jgi:hypothetical protein
VVRGPPDGDALDGRGVGRAAVAMAPVVMYERWAVCIDIRRPVTSASVARTEDPSEAV